LTEEATIKLAVKALMEVVESPKNIEIAIVKKGVPLRFLEVEEIEALVDAFEKEQKEKEGL
jgi:20S proteasome subunit alpha 4